MSSQDKPVAKRVASLKEHAAGIKAAAVWHQELVAAHLLKTQDPIKDKPTEATS